MVREGKRREEKKTEVRRKHQKQLKSILSALHVPNISEGNGYPLKDNGKQSSVSDQQIKHPRSRYDVVYPYNYKYLINEPEKCNRKPPFLVLMIATKPSEQQARTVIRQTWGNETFIPNVTVVCIFFLGRLASNMKSVQERIQNESRAHHDIIQRDFLDSYYNLTIKTMTAMEWVTEFCPQASYVMKIDSDIFLNIELLVNKVLKTNVPVRKKYFTGNFIQAHRPNRNKKVKWYIPQEIYPANVYPAYCAGGGYVFSGDIAEKIVNISYTVKPVYIEDIYVGMCLKKLRIKIKRNNLFRFRPVPHNICEYTKRITVHGFKPFKLLNLWKDFQQRKTFCSSDKTG
ncbi:beta-1,3-galactosyltransferase 2-like [Protopterus annectens]|uniref:beta-1,3-galactosyltransferase 2-like n=1 Tax=Protopterus annectens TaxID=7888 RepID=UPI001CF9DE58|nr:beta-1,3-galactosyltransferase 2-like [Protopterus annectens]